MNEPQLIQQILEDTKTIAVVGLSDNPAKASHGVSKFMQSRGYRVVPVNPAIASALGEKSYPSLEEAVAALSSEGVKVDLVNIFRLPQHLPPIVDDVIRLGLPAIWIQEGIINEEAAAKAEAHGVKVVMDRCILKDRMAAGWN
ncbi:CoA-binding protein [Silvibacterium sp.]|uniref:CoA-binding protein n=1 Tax=Silvibacterium sp. TaxID=1964179 RepID=UPI0039E7266E